MKTATGVMYSFRSSASQGSLLELFGISQIGSLFGAHAAVHTLRGTASIGHVQVIQVSFLVWEAVSLSGVVWFGTFGSGMTMLL